MKNLSGTYGQLWDKALAAEYDQDWLDSCAAIVGKEKAQDAVNTLKASVSGTVYGQEAVDKYKDSDRFSFNCDFTQNVQQVTFDGDKISGIDANGNEVFSHSYHYIGYDENMGFYQFQSADEASGEFTYMMLAPDTPATTYHIEFRYGSDLEALTKYDAGNYAYWMAAGIPVNADATMVNKAIELFCTENLEQES
ncbi:hypothetical protein JYB65_04465 [Clostridium aminobutyricum]|uniref:Uncharacterized protein n=1 Tax=Clostridium aminobutyricum TaxID=33953 RepID=A0A939D7F6_CLOAM|nr:hypothetical protein [Clostridium aminobutyricum]